MNDLDNERLNQLRNYAQWERENGPAGKLHILDWAASEIEGLTKQLEQAREALERIAETETDWRQSLDANMEGVRTVAYQALKQQEVGND